MLGENDLVRADTEQDLAVHFIGAFGDDRGNARLLAESDRHDAGFEMLRHANDDGINAADIKSGDDLGVRHVRAFANGEICRRVVDELLTFS